MALTIDITTATLKNIAAAKNGITDTRSWWTELFQLERGGAFKGLYWSPALDKYLIQYKRQAQHGARKVHRCNSIVEAITVYNLITIEEE